MFEKKENTESTYASVLRNKIKKVRHVVPGAVKEKGAQATTVFGGNALPRILLITLVFLLPILFVPASFASLSSTKMYFVYIVGVLLVGLFLVNALQVPTMLVQYNVIAFTSLLVVLGYIVAGLLSQNLSISLFGRDFAQDSVMAVVLLFGIGISVTICAKNALSSLYIYTAFIVSGLLVVVIHLLNILIPSFPSLGIFSSNITTTLGKWNDLGLFAALMVMMSMLAIERITFTKLTRLFLCITAVLSVAVVVLVNFTLSWWLLGIFTLFMLAQTFVQGKKHNTKKISVRALLLLGLCIIFLVFGQFIGRSVSQTLQIEHLEVRPSLEATVTITQQALTGSRIFVGVGPALFEHVWPLFRPVSVLATNFWNIDFRYGFGLLPTFIVTTGLIGAVSWALFLLSLLWVTVRALRTHVAQSQDVFLLTASAVSMWFLWAVFALYLPSTTLVTLTIVSTGLFLGTAIRLGVLPVKALSLQSRIPLLIARVIVVVLIVGLSGVGVQATAKFVAHVYFKQSVAVLAATNDNAQIEQYLAKAVQFDGIDTYYRSLGEVGIAQLNAVIANVNTGEQTDPELFRTVANRVIQNYEQAITYDPRNHTNYIGLANFYAGMVALGVDGVYDTAKQLYSKALEMKPGNPSVHVAIAQLEVANRNVPAARAAIEKALEIKSNYSEAYLLLTQLELSQGRRDLAINVMRRAGAANPNDPFTYFQLGLLEYDNQNFDEAVLAFERAISLNPGFQNAKYFLGLSYYEVGETQSALRQFEELYVQNKNNTELQTIISNVRSGRAPIETQQILELPLTDEEVPIIDTEELENVE